LFGSGVSELFELHKLLTFLVNQTQNLQPTTTEVLSPLSTLLNRMTDIDFNIFNDRMSALEDYRDAIEQPLSTESVPYDLVQTVLNKMKAHLDQTLVHYETLDIMPTYITYEAKDYQVLREEGDVAFVDVTSFKSNPVPLFLEANARYLKSVASKEKAVALHKEVKSSDIYDDKLKMFKTSAPLDHASYELGRIKAFTAGWLERESIFLHMTYKYLLGLIVSGAYDDFYEAIQTNMICFLDETVYGRSTLENSSFLASSKNPDPRLHGQGFVARLSGSTAEMISMWRYMFLGKNIFTYDGESLSFQLKPNLKSTWFNGNILTTTLFSTIHVIYEYQGKKDTFDDDVYVSQYELIDDKGTTHMIEDENVTGSFAEKIRNKEIKQIKVVLKERS
jgi:hypothetical protein